MFHKLQILLTCLSAAVLGATAMPHHGRAPVWSTHVLRTCEQSVNCAVVNGEPVIDHAFTRALLARRDVASTNKTTIVADSGVVDASNCVPADLIQSALTDHCTTGGCTTDAQTFKCKPHRVPGFVHATDTTSCTVTQDGEYTTGAADLTHMFVDVVQAAARAHTKSQSKGLGRRDLGLDIHNIVPKSIQATHTVTIDGQDALAGHVRYTIQCQDQNDGECNTILDNIDGIVGLLAPDVEPLVGIISKGC